MANAQKVPRGAPQATQIVDRTNLQHNASSELLKTGESNISKVNECLNYGATIDQSSLAPARKPHTTLRSYQFDTIELTESLMHRTSAILTDCELIRKKMTNNVFVPLEQRGPIKERAEYRQTAFPHPLLLFVLIRPLNRIQL